jgi:hypothetical protein
MSEKFYYRLVHDQARRGAAEACMRAPEGWIVTIKEPTRTLDQNAAQWPILGAIADQLRWPVNGQMVSLTDEEFKDILTAAFNKETLRIAQGVDGGVVMLGIRTSKMGKKEFSEWLDFLHWFCADRGVDLSIKPKKQAVILRMVA